MHRGLYSHGLRGVVKDSWSSCGLSRLTWGSSSINTAADRRSQPGEKLQVLSHLYSIFIDL